MKLSKKVLCDSIAPNSWKCFDNCPVCKLFKEAVEKDRELSEKELSEAFEKAEREAAD